MSKYKVIIGILSASLVVSVSALGYFYINKDKDTPITEYETAVNQITEIDYEERQRQIDQIVEDGMMNVQYLSSCQFDGKISKTFNVKNIENNKHPIVFSILDSNGDVIYQSKKIELGYELNSIELDKELPSGVHECLIQIGYEGEGNVSSVFPITLEVF